MTEALESRVHVTSVTQVSKSVYSVSRVLIHLKNNKLRVKFSSFDLFTAVLMGHIFVKTGLRAIVYLAADTRNSFKQAYF